MNFYRYGILLLFNCCIFSAFSQSETDVNGRLVPDEDTTSVQEQPVPSDAAPERPAPLFAPEKVNPSYAEQEWSLQTIVPRLIKLEEEVRRLRIANDQLQLENRMIKQHLGWEITAPGAYLLQTAPTPENSVTTLQYSIPEAFESARIDIKSTYGETLGEFPIKLENATGQLSFKPYALTTGTYLYFLVVDEAIVDSKILLITP